MKYIVQVEVDPDAGDLIEGDPATMQKVLGAWQALNPIGMYVSLTRRAITIIVDLPNEDAMFEALHATWVGASTYPEVWPVATMDEFPGLLRRVGLGPG